ncbi:MAG: RluA family pseudouridine synthase [Planctomycetota bacterium]|nr:RluA family pseudouridine synthase [Planctomycetota bacterium]
MPMKTTFGEILHSDDRILVIDKPSGLLSVPGIGSEKQDVLATRAARQFKGARIVHRLDRDTSGVIVMALDAEAHRHLSMQFQDREVEKSYIAIVQGIVKGEHGEITLPLRKDMDNPPRQIVDHDQGKWASTKWRVIERNEDRTRLELTPLTGRSHQLRVHLLQIGHPILGDDLYAPPEALNASSRLMLHALTLSLVHQETASPMSFTAPFPF